MVNFTNKYNLPAPLVAAIKNDSYIGGGDISTTLLISPPRIRQLSKRYAETATEDIVDNIWRLIGTNTHYILERVNLPGCVKEVRYGASVNGWELTGQIDLYEPDTLTLSDYKVTSVWSVIHGVKPEYEAQANINAWLMRQNGIHPAKLQIVNLLRDWSKHKAHEQGYPDCQVVVQNIPLWLNEYTYQFILKRVCFHQECETISDEALPVCTPEERWERPTTYAVMKPGRKSAIRVCDSQEQAQEYIKNRGLDDKHFIQVRPGKSVRCESYCSVNKYCSFWRGQNESV